MKEIKNLISILKNRGYVKHASKLEEESKRFKVKTDPLTVAVSLGLLHPSILTELEDESIDQGHEEDLRSFEELLDNLKEQV